MKIHLSISQAFTTTLIIFMTVISCKNPESKHETEISEDPLTTVILDETQMKNAGIETAAISDMMIGSTLQLKGVTELRPYEKVSVTSPSGGYIKSLPIMKGMFVTKGNILAIIEDPSIIQLQEDYLKVKFSIQYLDKEFKRQKSLLEDRAVSEKSVLAAESELIQKRIEKKALEEKLLLLQLKPHAITEENITSAINLKAPISGYISQISANVGKRVSPTETLLEVIDVSRPYLALKAFEKDLPHLVPGQKVLAYTNENKDKKLAATIRFIGQEISHEGNTEIVCEFSQSVKLPSGMYMNAEIETNNRTSKALPETAVVVFEGKSYVFAEIKRGTYEMVEVTPGTTQHGRIEVTSQLDTNLRFVTKGSYTLLMELKNTAE
jgi:cobalt-zinc-cadmium efflux system membrane fusion protein